MAMATDQKSVNGKIWDDDWFSNLENHEKLVFLHLLTTTGRKISGIITTPLENIVSAVNPRKFRDEQERRIEYFTEYGELPNDTPRDFIYYSKKRVIETLEKFEKNKKIIVLPDNKFLLTNYHKNQALKNQSSFESVLNELISLMQNYEDEVTSKLRKNKQFIIDLSRKIVDFGEKHFFKKNPAKDNNDTLVSSIIKFISFVPDIFIGNEILSLCEKYCAIYNLKEYKELKIPLKSINDPLCTHSASHSDSTVHPPCRQINLNLNQNKTKTNTKLKQTGLGLGYGLGGGVGEQEKTNSSSVTKAKNASHKILSLRGQDFEDAIVGLKNEWDKAEEKEDQETQAERSARLKKEIAEARDLAMALMKTYKGKELKQKLKKVLQPKESEEYKEFAHTDKGKHCRIPAKQYYFSEVSIPDAQIPDAERVVGKVNEYVIDNFDTDAQIPALNPFSVESAYKILNDFFPRGEGAFLEELFSHFEEMKKDDRLKKIRNLDMHIYAFGTNTPIEHLMNKELL